MTLVACLAWAADDSLAQSAPQTHAVQRTDISPGDDEPRHGWAANQIGAPALESVALDLAGGIALAGSGSGIDRTADGFHFLHQPATGDLDLVTRLVFAEGPDAMQGGLMVRASLEAGSPHASVIASNGVVSFVQRPVAGSPTLSLPSALPLIPGASSWLKLQRRGDVVSAFWSPDAASWTMVGSGVIELPSSTLLGMAVSSRSRETMAWGYFDNVFVGQSSTGGIAQDDTVRTNSATARGTEEHASSPAARQALRRPPSSGADVEPSGAPEGSDAAAAVRATTPARPGVTRSSSSDPPRVAVRRDGTRPLGPPPTAGPPSEPGPRTSPRRIPPASRWAAFTPSADHHGNVDGYALDVIRAGTSVVVARLDLGKPPVIGGECRVEIGAFLSGLPSGTYVAVLRAVNTHGASSTVESPPFTR